MPFLDNTLRFQRSAIQCNSVTKLYSAVAWLFDSVPFLRCGLPITSVPSPGFSMLFRSGVVLLQGVSKLFLRLSELFHVDASQFLRASNLSYAFAGQSEAIQRCTIHFRCFTPHYISALFRLRAAQGLAKLFHGFSIQRKSVSGLRYATACPIPVELIPCESWLC